MAKHNRVALFMDYENFYTTLQSRSKNDNEIHIDVMKIDFFQLVDTIRDHYGLLSQDDFIVTANFSHYDKQKGGLNQVATLINVDSFENRHVRSKIQPSPGKKYVIKDYADMQLAFEIGQHTAFNPADLYIIASGDKAFAAIGRTLQKKGFPVLFLLSYPDQAAVIIKEEFTWIDFLNTQHGTAKEDEKSKKADEKSETPDKTDAVDELCHVISVLRQEFSTSIPLILIKAIYGSEKGYHLVQSAQSRGRVDIWDDPNGITCVSRLEERMFHKVMPITTRSDFVVRAEKLYKIKSIAETGLKEATRSEWRRALKEQGEMSVKDAKQLLNTLLEQGILKDGNLGNINLPLETIISFLKGE